MPAEVEKRIQAFLDAGSAFDQVRAILVTVHGRPVFERYYHSSAATTGNAFSVTKSVMSMLIGIAIDERKLRGVDQTLAELLPAYAGPQLTCGRLVRDHEVLVAGRGDVAGDGRGHGGHHRNPCADGVDLRGGSHGTERGARHLEPELDSAN